MNQTKKKSFFWSKIVEIYRQVFDMLKKDPTIWVLFGFLAVLDGIALMALFLSHSEPFSYLFAPLIRTFWSDAFLHYPYNFQLLPKLFGHAHFVITTLIGSFISAIVIKKIDAHMQGATRVSIFAVSSSIFKRYLGIIFAWLLSYALFNIAFAVASPLLIHNFWVHIIGTFIIGLVVQSLLIFIIPSVVLLDGGYIRNLGDAFSYGIRHLTMSIGIIALPMVLIVGLSYLKSLSPYLFLKTNPEMVLWILLLEIPILTFVDMMITGSSTILFLKARKNK